MGFKNKKETILEFLRIKPDYEFGSNYLIEHTQAGDNKYDLKDIEPYNQASAIFL